MWSIRINEQFLEQWFSHVKTEICFDALLKRFEIENAFMNTYVHSHDIQTSAQQFAINPQ